MRLNCGEGNGASLARRTSQSTDRIARTLINAPVCRAFLRSVFTAITLVGSSIARISQIATAYRPGGNRLFSRSFSSVMVTAVGAVAILASFTMAYRRSPCILLPVETHS